MVTMPVQKGFVVTSRFGPRWGTTHWGTDFGVDGGSGGKPVFAVKSGTVTRAGPASGFGRWVTIDHPAANGGGETVYGHVIPEVRAGQRVSEGQRIARIDPNSATNGGVAPHLHLEWHRYSWSPPGPNRLDPMVMLKGAKWPGESAPSAGSTVQRSKDIFDIDWSQRFWENGSYSPKRLIVLHTTENSARTTAESVARFQLGPENTWKGAYTGLVDSRGVALRANTDDQRVPAAGNDSNRIGMHLSFVAYASWSRSMWLRQEKMLRRGARVVADWCTKHGIPARVVTPEQAARGSWGITDHNGTRLAFGETTHTDVGPNFPWAEFMEMVQDCLNPKEGVVNNTTVLGGVSAAALHEAKIDSARAREILESPVASLINPSKEFTPITFLRIIDAAVWEQGQLLRAIAEKLKLDPQQVIAQAVQADRRAG